MATLGTLVVSFFRNHLAGEKGLSGNSVGSYSDCIRLLLEFSCKALGTTIDKLALDRISDTVILDFLDHLENERGNTPATRNQRLAAIKTFYRFIARSEVSLLQTCERVCAICGKKTAEKLFTTLETDEVAALLAAPDADTLDGARDAVALNLFYTTGARVQELVGLDLADLRLDRLGQARLTGKGKKDRIVPLCEETVRAIDRYLQLRAAEGIDSDALLLNARGRRITRFGMNYLIDANVSRAAATCPSLKNKHVTAHTFRHTTALHLIQAGEDIVTVKELLGHADIGTTAKYIRIDMNMKRKALEHFPVRPQPPGEKPPEGTCRWRNPDVRDFLRKLSRQGTLCGENAL